MDIKTSEKACKDTDNSQKISAAAAPASDNGDAESNTAEESSHVLEKRVLRKIDFHLMLPLWVIFLFGFLDRINLGNAAVLGIKEELNLRGNEFNIAMQVFFVPYILLEIPSNIVLKKLSPSSWIAGLTFMWGVASMCQGVVRNNSGLIACRFFIGVFEAGFVPGCAYLMSMFYKRHEFQKRFSFFWVAGLMAGAFGGLLAYALNHMEGSGGYSGWRWIFIIEGLISIVLAVPAKWFIADWPEQARFLSPEEKSFVLSRSSKDLGGGGTMDRLDGEAWKRILSDRKIYVGSLIYIGITVSGYATALFIPTLMNSLGYPGIQSQIQSIPVWVVTACVTMTVSYLADRLQHRYGFIMFGVLFGGIGYIILLCQGPPEAGLSLRVRHMAIFFVCIGTYIVQPVTIVWMANNMSGHYKRAIGLAIQIGFGNIGGIIASNIFVTRDAPRYFVGYGVALAMMIFCGIMSSVFAAAIVFENKMREQGKRDHRLQMEERILGNMGDDDPRFRFSL